MAKRILLHSLLIGSCLFSSLIWSEPCSKNTEQISIRYLGIGALDIRYQNQRLLTDPFYTPFSIWDIATLSKFKSDPDAIKHAIGPYKQNVNAVLVGHGHYDHIADLPAIKNYLKDDALIVASKTSINMISSSFDLEQLIPITDVNTGTWLYLANGWIRVKAQSSEHAPQIFNINLFPGKEDLARNTIPSYIWQWKQGTNLTFTLDFLHEPYKEDVNKRLFLQTSASNFPIGFQPITDGHKVDLAMLAAASFENVDDYPMGLLRNYQPNTTLFIHWENFFKPWINEPEALTLINFEKLMRNSKNSHNGSIEIAQPNHCYSL